VSIVALEAWSENGNHPCWFGVIWRIPVKGAISMTKTIVVPGNPPAHQTLSAPINSIVAAAKTAVDLESARRKATKDKDQISPIFPNELNAPPMKIDSLPGPERRRVS
jgi:hypothetical protein